MLAQVLNTRKTISNEQIDRPCPLNLARQIGSLSQINADINYIHCRTYRPVRSLPAECKRAKLWASRRRRFLDIGFSTQPECGSRFLRNRNSHRQLNDQLQFACRLGGFRSACWNSSRVRHKSCNASCRRERLLAAHHFSWLKCERGDIPTYCCWDKRNNLSFCVSHLEGNWYRRFHDHGLSGKHHCCTERDKFSNSDGSIIEQLLFAGLIGFNRCPTGIDPNLRAKSNYAIGWWICKLANLDQLFILFCNRNLYCYHNWEQR